MGEIEKVVNGISDIDLKIKNELTFGSAGEETTITKKEIAQWEVTIESTLELIADFKEVILDLLNIGYPHNFQHENPWIVNYMYGITKIVDKAYEVMKKGD